MIGLWLTLMTGCTEHELHRNEQEDEFFQERDDSVDILFVVDDSVSMRQEQELLAQGFFRFAERLQEEDLSFHLGVVTTDMDDANPDAGRLIGVPKVLTDEDEGFLESFMERVQVGTEGSDKEQGIEAGVRAMQHPENEGFLREEATLAVIYVSDENDCSNDGAFLDESDGKLCYEYPEALTSVLEDVRRYQGIKGPDGRLVVSGIVGPEPEAGCDNSWRGKRYETVIRKLDGINGNICDANYEQILEEMSERIVGPSRVFQLTYAAVEETLVVTVDGEVIEPDETSGWTYDNELWMLRFDGVYVPPPLSHIVVDYTIAGG